jgi:hypothetical protein
LSIKNGIDSFFVASASFAVLDETEFDRARLLVLFSTTGVRASMPTPVLRLLVALVDPGVAGMVAAASGSMVMAMYRCGMSVEWGVAVKCLGMVAVHVFLSKNYIR